MFWLILIGTLVYFFASLAKSVWSDPFWLIPIGFLVFAVIFPGAAGVVFCIAALVATAFGLRETWRGSAY